MKFYASNLLMSLQNIVYKKEDSRTIFSPSTLPNPHHKSDMTVIENPTNESKSTSAKPQSATQKPNPLSPSNQISNTRGDKIALELEIGDLGENFIGLGPAIRLLEPFLSKDNTLSGLYPGEGHTLWQKLQSYGAAIGRTKVIKTLRETSQLSNKEAQHNYWPQRTTLENDISDLGENKLGLIEAVSLLNPHLPENYYPSGLYNGEGQMLSPTLHGYAVSIGRRRAIEILRTASTQLSPHNQDDGMAEENE
jgi:hypothetical protein